MSSDVAPNLNLLLRYHSEFTPCACAGFSVGDGLQQTAAREPHVTL